MQEHKTVILLCGKTASGKSTIAKYCKEKYGLTFAEIHCCSDRTDEDILVLNGTEVSSVKSLYSDKNIAVVYVTASKDRLEAFKNLYERMRADGKSAKEASMTAALDNFKFKGVEDMADYVTVNECDDDIAVNAKKINGILKGDEI